jgi:parallel beta-helix repeat protein
MTNRVRFAVFSAIMTIAVAVPASLHAATLYVGTCGAPNKPTIQAAVNASSQNDTVLVCPGTYAEQVTITKNLTITGLTVGTADQVVITSPAGGVVRNAYDLYQYGSNPVSAQVLVQNTRNVVLNNITVDGAGNGINGCAPDFRGIYYQNASGTIENVTARNQILSPGLTGCQSGEAIYVQSGYGSSTPQFVTIVNSSVRNFQKNGITVDGDPLSFLVQKNYIVGVGPTTGAAENGIQISDGATGAVLNNTTIDEIYSPGGYGASGILIYAAPGVEVGFNTVGSTQYGIVTVSDPSSGSTHNPQGLADHTNIHDNTVLGTQIFDGIDVCSNSNTVVNNTVFSSAEAGIHLDGECGTTGKNNVVLSNTVNDACAGILQGGTPNTLGGGSLLGGLLGGLLGLPVPGSNTFYNVPTTVLAGDVCPVASTQTPAFTTNALSLAAAAGGNTHPQPVQ